MQIAPSTSTPCGLTLARAVAIAAATLCMSAQAALITQTININGNATLGGFTNGAPQVFFSLPSVFNQFNAAGSLTSATVSWTTTGVATASGNLEAQGALSFLGQSASINVDTDGNPANGQSFSFSGTQNIVSLAPLLGSGTVDLGSFVGTMANVGGLFPWGGTLSATGTMTLVYDYVADTGGGPPTPTLPEPTSLALAAVAAAGFAFARRQRRR
jgi:MYXO-CTERM domain-containing protein